MLFRSQIHKSIAIAAGLNLILLATLVFACQELRFSSKYENPAVYGGLFYVVSSPDKFEERALVLSYDDKPIEPKANDPDAPTIPGFYLSYKERYDFERVEVIGKKVYFKTRSIGGVSYEFIGSSGEEVIPAFNSSDLIPYIVGTLTELRDGKAVKKEEIKFTHAVIA